jgi:leucyl-tRNA synthetase
MLEFPECMNEFEGKNVFYVAATLRPETMYGQTNCFVLPTGKYGIFEMPGDEYFVCSERAMKNMAYQDITKEFGKWDQVGTVKGEELIGIPLKAPLAKFDKVYTIPLLTISMNKGTGIVTSVPSDAPNDYMALIDFQTKEKMRQKYKVEEEWVKGFDPVPIIDIPIEETKEEEKEIDPDNKYEMIAVELCKKMKIKSQKDIKKLDEAKDIAYKKGFNYGVFSIGEYKGEKVSEAKDKVKNMIFRIPRMPFPISKKRKSK